MLVHWHAKSGICRRVLIHEPWRRLDQVGTDANRLVCRPKTQTEKLTAETRFPCRKSADCNTWLWGYPFAPYLSFQRVFGSLQLSFNSILDKVMCIFAIFVFWQRGCLGYGGPVGSRGYLRDSTRQSKWHGRESERVDSNVVLLHLFFLGPLPLPVCWLEDGT